MGMDRIEGEKYENKKNSFLLEHFVSCDSNF